MKQTPDNEKILSRIKKLFALAKSSNQHEAASALSKAQKLMQVYNLSEADVALTDIELAYSKGAPSDATSIPRYVIGLAGTIERVMGCHHYFSRRFGKRHVAFYGPSPRAEIAAYLFDVLTRKVKAARKEFIATQNKRIKRATKTARADAFCEAWMAAIYNAVTVFAVTEHERQLMVDWIDNLQRKSGREFDSVSGRAAKKARGIDDAERAGYHAGSKVKLHQAMNARQGEQSDPALLEG